MTSYLAIDTASSTLALALGSERGILRSLAKAPAADHSQPLFAAIEELLAGEPLSRLGGVAVVRGPGSYAGLRVGIASAEGLALSRGLPLRGITTLEAVAAAAGPGSYTAIHPAGRGEFAAQPFREGQPAGPLAAARVEDLAGLELAGEGAGALGGREVTPDERCRAALGTLIPLFEGDTAPETVQALYLREPSITLARRAPVAREADARST